MRPSYQDLHGTQARPDLRLRTDFVHLLGLAGLSSLQATVESVGPASSRSDVETEDCWELWWTGDGEGMPLEPADLRDVDEDIISAPEVKLSLQHQPRHPGLESSGLNHQAVSVACQISQI